MGTKNLFVIVHISFLFTLASCLQTTGFDFRKNTQTQEQEQEEERDQNTKLDLKKRDNSKPFRPPVTLVLGPGLARSIAHIGVLKILSTSDITIDKIIGLGWGALAAYEFATEKAVHGLEWKISRSEALKDLNSKSFWSKELKLKTLGELKDLIKDLVTQNSGTAEIPFYCPLYATSQKKSILTDEKGLAYCMAMPPLFSPGRKYAPSFYGLDKVRQSLKKTGREKFIYIDVLGPGIDWGASASSLNDFSFWQWNYNYEILRQDLENYDKVFKVGLNSSLLDFNHSLDLIKEGEKTGKQLIEFLKEEYQY